MLVQKGNINAIYKITNIFKFMTHILNKKALLIIPVMLILTVSKLFAQSPFIKYGDNYLKGKDGFEKNDIKAAECYQRAADVGDERGIKRLKKMGMSGEEWTPFASLFVDRCKYDENFPNEDNILFLVTWGKGKDYNEAMKAAMNSIRNECNTEIGESCALKAYHLICALETKEWTRVAVQTIFEVSDGSSSGSSFKIGPKKNVSDFRFKNAVNSLNTFFDAMYEYLPYVLKANNEVKKTEGPTIRGDICIGYKDYKWTSLLSIVPAIAFSKKEANRYMGNGIIQADGDDFGFKHYDVPKEPFSKRHNAAFDFTRSVSAISELYRTNIWACLPTFAIVTDASVQKVTSLKVEGMIESDLTNRRVHFNMNKDCVGYTDYMLNYTWEQFNKVNEVEVKSEDELNFGQQIMLLEDFAGNYTNTFSSLLNKYKRQNAGYPDRLQALKKIEDLANCEISGRQSMDKGLNIRYKGEENLYDMEAAFSTVSGRNKAELNKKILRVCSRLLEMCNEAILYFDEAKQAFQQCYGENPKPYLKELIDKCDRELNGVNGLNEKKEHWTLLIKQAKSNK